WIRWRPGWGSAITRWAWLPRRMEAGWPSTVAVQPGIQVSATTSRPGASVATLRAMRSGPSECQEAGGTGGRRRGAAARGSAGAARGEGREGCGGRRAGGGGGGEGQGVGGGQGGGVAEDGEARPGPGAGGGDRPGGVGLGAVGHEQGDAHPVEHSLADLAASA